MRTTRIFVGSSEELKADRLALSDFINRLNNAYVPYGRRFLFVMWEHESIAIAAQEAGKQAEYDELVRGCDACLFLFHRRCGEYTLEEVETALDERARTGGMRPRIFTWMRELGPGECATPELERFRARIDAGELGLSYQEYRDVRTVELALLEELAPLGATLPSQRIDDFVYVGDEAVIDLGSPE